MTTQTDDALDALNAIDPNCDRDTWVRLAAAAREAGVTLQQFSDWSSRASNYDAKDTASMWKSLSRMQNIGPGTLFALAAEAGWKNPLRERTVSPAGQAKKKAQAKPRKLAPAGAAAPEDAEDRAKEAEDAEQARQRVAAILSAAIPAPEDHPYLVRKRMPASGLKAIAMSDLRRILGYVPTTKRGPLEGPLLLVVPLHAGDHRAQSLEIIDGAGRKWGMAGLPRRGLAWSQFDAPLPVDTLMMGIAEGVATATAGAICANMPVIAAGSYSNMRSVLESWMQQYPMTEFVLLADLGNSLAPTQALADQFGIGCIHPDPARVGEGGTDFDDFLRCAGTEAAWEWTQNALDENCPLLLWERVKHVPIDYVLPGLPTGTLGLLVGPGGVGKSFLSKEFAVATALGASPAQLPGFPTDGPQGHSALLLGEDSDTIIGNRMAAYMEVHRIPARTLAKRVMVRGLDGKDMRILSFGRPGAEPEEMPFLTSLRRICEGRRLVIIDPMIRMHDAQENDNNAANKFMLALQRVCRATNCAIVLLHHVGKGGKDGWEASRGASAFTTSARWQMMLRPPTEKEVATYQIEDATQFGYLARVKANYAESNSGGTWLTRSKGGVLVPHKFAPVGSARSLPGGFPGGHGSDKSAIEDIDDWSY